jgi:hypothetical protein
MTEPKAPKPNPAQGANGSKEPETVIERVDQLRGLSPDEINRLRHEGKLDRIMKGGQR